MKALVQSTLIVFLLLPLQSLLYARLYVCNPSDYKEKIDLLQPGDTLFLKSGIYKSGLTLNNVNGELNNNIVILGENSDSTIFEARSGANTVSLTKCSFLYIKDLTIDGLGLGVDAVKAEGTKGNFVHDIILEGLTILNHGADQQIVGISTKCTAWNCIIRNNRIIGAGTGIYLGNSDGTAPFVNGIIEYNLVVNTIGYNMEIKYQKDSLRTLPGMVLDGKTIIRYNVFSKEKNASSGGSARPCLLVGNFPSAGDGANDYYEIYGNFFWQNPVEALFQGTGNIAFYSNILVNQSDPDGCRAVYITKQDNFKPRNIYIFHNTIWVKNSSGGIRLYSADKTYQQLCRGNAIFSPVPISNIPNSSDNITGSYDSSAICLTSPSADIPALDLYPLPGRLEGNEYDLSQLNKFTDWDKDFNGNQYSKKFRGAYSGSGLNPGWKPVLDMRPLVTPSSGIDDNDLQTDEDIFWIYPNPAGNKLFLKTGIDAKEEKCSIYSLNGTKLKDVPLYKEIDIQDLPAGIYLLKSGKKSRVFFKK